MIWITTHLPTLKEWKAGLAWLSNPEQTLYSWSSHMYTTDMA